MKIVITSVEPRLDAELDPHFGRARYLLLVDPSDSSYEVIENPHRELAQGVGIQVARLVVAAGARAVLTGSCGPKAMDVLSAARISVVTGCRGTVRDAIEAFRSGGSEPAEVLAESAPPQPDDGEPPRDVLEPEPEGVAVGDPRLGRGMGCGMGHGWGPGPGRGRGSGRGLGRRRGWGWGRGRALGMGRGRSGA